MPPLGCRGRLDHFFNTHPLREAAKLDPKGDGHIRAEALDEFMPYAH